MMQVGPIRSNLRRGLPLAAAGALAGAALLQACSAPDAEVPVEVALPFEPGQNDWAALVGTSIKGLILSVREGVPGEERPTVLGQSFYDASTAGPPAMSVHGLVGGDNRYVVLEGVDVGAAALATNAHPHVLTRGSTVPASYAPSQSAIPSGSSYPPAWMFFGRVDQSNLLRKTMAGGHAFFAAADIGGGEILIAGGLDDTGGPSAGIEVFQRNEFLFKQTNFLQVPRSWPSCVAIPEGGVLVAGGLASNGALVPDKRAERIDADGSPEVGFLDLGYRQLYGAATAARINGAPHVVIAGGSSTDRVSDAVSNVVYWDGVALAAYDPLNLARSYLSATGLPDGRVFLAGGYFSQNLGGVITHGVAASGEILDDSALYHINSVPGLRPRWAHSATLVRTSADGVLLVGGAATLVASTGGWPDYGPAVATVDLVLPHATGAAATIATAATLHFARAQHTAATFGDGDVLICGGVPVAGLTPAEGPSYQPLASCEIWRRRTGTIDTAGSMSLPRAGHQAFDLHDGSVLLLGGITRQGQPTNLAEIYIPRWPDEK